MDLKLEDIFKMNLSTDVNKDDMLSDLVVSSLLAKTSVPYSHRRIASDYVILKQIFDFQTVQPKITLVESEKLKKYHFDTLENTTISQANKELALLKEWATSTDDNLRDDSVELLSIRVKELKYMLSYSYTNSTNEVFKGYKAVDAYLISIPRYYN